jgi:endonuclease YncB( thermonuclease family)
MWRPYQFLIPLLSLFLNRVDLTDLYPMVVEVKLLKILDADTITVKYSDQILKVRISKIDSAEMGQPFWNKKGNAGLEALKCVKKVIGDRKKFQLKIYGQDMYGRILGDIDNLSLTFVISGCTGLYHFAKFDSKHEKWEYIRALNRAKQLKMGVWKYGGYIKPNLWRKKKRRRTFGKI